MAYLMVSSTFTVPTNATNDHCMTKDTLDRIHLSMHSWSFHP